MIRNVYLRVLLTPIVFLIWLVQLCVFGIMGCLGFFFGLMGLFNILFFGSSEPWESEKEILFTLMIGWWAYYPWLWWYRYFKTGDFRVLEEFRGD